MSPPTMAIPGPSQLRPDADRGGGAPSIAAIVVIMIGRKRSARLVDRLRGIASPRSASRAKSIIMIAFFFTMPTRAGCRSAR
jgi:hypothetical protein